jgi:hypothetical protein
MDFIKHIKEGEDDEEITQTYLHSEETQSNSNKKSSKPAKQEQ